MRSYFFVDTPVSLPPLQWCAQAQDPTDTSRGLVYFIETQGWTKIGFTASSVKQRLKAFETGAPPSCTFNVRMLLGPAGYTLEHALHHRFREARAPRGEWFASNCLADFVEDLAHQDRLRNAFYIDAPLLDAAGEFWEVAIRIPRAAVFDEAEPSRTYSSREAAYALNISPSDLTRMAREGAIEANAILGPTGKVKAWRFPHSAIVQIASGRPAFGSRNCDSDAMAQGQAPPETPPFSSARDVQDR